MGSPDDFWLTLHNLAETINSGDGSLENQTQRIIDSFRDIAPTAQRRLFNEVVLVNQVLEGLYPLVRHVSRDTLQV